MCCQIIAILIIRDMIKIISFCIKNIQSFFNIESINIYAVAMQ